MTQAPKYDVMVMAARPYDQTYIQYAGRYTTCSTQAGTTFPNGTPYNGACVNEFVPVQIAVPDGGRGSTPLDPN